MRQFLHEKAFVHIGFIRKVHGYKGDVKVALEEVYVKDLLETKFIFIEFGGHKVPFRVENVSSSVDIIVKFDKVDGAQISGTLARKQLFLLEDQLVHAKKFISEQKKKNEWVGYHIIDEVSGLSFEIMEIQEFPQQIMAVVANEAKDILIPLHKEFILNIDNNKKNILMKIPDGLLDL